MKETLERGLLLSQGAHHHPAVPLGNLTFQGLANINRADNMEMIWTSDVGPPPLKASLL
jgi:hypothetical protein